ncbi:hypothetical protein [Neobacillus sp. SAB-20_R2A]|uniref:hypothetical protein n=1 Tax=Neobacillus sp. SAB-20_R2A TaxID=3120519 RepID=UPI003C6DCB88
MKKKLFMLLTGSVLSAMMLVGCNNARNDINPPPPRVDNDLNDNMDRNDLNNRNNLNDRDRMNNRLNNDLNDNPMDRRNHYPESEDKNTPTDKDWIKDNNTKQEDIIEDDIDVKDRDNKDE